MSPDDKFDHSDVREPPAKATIEPEGLEQVLALAADVLEDFRWDTGEKTRIERLATWVQRNLSTAVPCGFEVEAASEGWVTSPQLGTMSPDDARGLAAALLRAAGP